MTSLIDLRREEFNCIGHYFRPGLRVLEIGGGNGYQASLIAARGADVESVDVAAPLVGEQIFFPVDIYDGRSIPFANHVFDVVFSSNVLEHIRDLDAMLIEIQRVLKKGGLSIHILPSPSWRLWTSLSHYVHIGMRILGWRRSTSERVTPLHAESVTRSRMGMLSIVKRALLAGPHGEYPSAFSELWYFSKTRWVSVFRRNRLRVIEVRPSGIFYTGYALFPSLSLSVRKKLARSLGTATHIYVLQNSG